MSGTAKAEARIETSEALHLGALAVKAYELRRDVIEMIHAAGSGHPGGSFSLAEIVTALYGGILRIDPARPSWAVRDRVVLSKGHSAPILYAALADRGYFPRERLWTLRRIDSILQGHPDFRKTPGLDMTSGSLGQGLSVGLGMALGARHRPGPFQVYVLLSDGELQEGMVWEAAMAAAHYAVGNLTAVIDRNNLQVDGFLDQVMGIEPLSAKLEAFGWSTSTIDGHDLTAIRDALWPRRDAPVHGKPHALICRTTKGKGVSFMENVMEWHASPIDVATRDRALEELDRTITALRADADPSAPSAARGGGRPHRTTG